MAAVASAADQTAELMQKLSMESKNKTHEHHEGAKKPSGVQYGSSNGMEAPKFQIASSERSLTPVLPEYVDHNMCYLPNGYPSTAYYYGGYDGSVGEWDYSRYPEGVDVSHGVYGDVYGYGYAPYSTYHSSGTPVPSLGHDSQMYGAQHYQYPSPYFQPQATINGAYPSNSAAPRTDVNSATVADKSAVSVESVKSNSANGSTNGSNDPVLLKQNQQNASLTSNGMYGRGALVGGHASSVYQDPRYSFDAMRSPVSWYDGSGFSDGYARSTSSNTVSSTASHNNIFDSSRNHNPRTVPQLMGYHAPRPTTGMGPQTHGIVNRMYPTNRMYEQCTNAYRPGIGYGSNVYDPRLNGRWGMFMDGKYKPRGSANGFYGYGNENLDGLSELNRGPRANRFKSFKGTDPTNENVEDPSIFPDREQYNRTDFSDRYSDAKFFVIKSYSEDDIHKSIKYSVWASTPNGNKKLDAAYKEAQGKAVECPVFLFFSVNTSGQFVGVAEMVGSVDFNKTVDYWQQDKWTGCFSVKWHIVKDVPNNILKHITIENNDNKPVTNSRDTQEVKLDQGLQMLQIFKEHSSKTSILDDFGFYEARQKVMQEKRTKQQQLSRPMVEIKPPIPVDDKGKDGYGVNPGLQKPLQPVTVMKKEVTSVCISERKQSSDNSLPSDAVDAPKGAKAVPEKKPVSNGAVNSAVNGSATSC